MVARAVACAAALLVIAGLVWRGWPADPGPGGPDLPARAAANAPVDARARTAAETASLPPLPASLAGTALDGGFVVDAHGRLVVTRDALDLFDYYLAASGEEPLATIRARIAREIETRLPPDARPAAFDLLERYLAYREALRALHRDEGLAELALELRFQRIRELRREHFAAHEREALFAAEEERWRIDLERRRVAMDPDLSSDERAQRLAALDAELPREVREARETTLAALRLREDEAALRARGASDAEIHALRERRFGADAAARLAALDRQRAHWDERVQAWHEERARLVAAGASAEEVATRRAERFQGPELQRVVALERLAAN